MDHKKIGEFIRDKRKSINLTQGELADLIQVSHQAVSRWENGDNLPDVEKLYELSLLFKVSIDEIINVDKQDIKAAKNNLGFYKIINAAMSVISLILFYVLLLSSGVYWLPFIMHFLILIGSSLLYIIPFSNLENKQMEDFKQVRISIILSLSSMILSLMSLVKVYAQGGFLIWLLLAAIVTIVVAYVLNTLLKVYETNNYSSDSVSLKRVICKDKYIIGLLEFIGISLVAILLVFLLYEAAHALGIALDPDDQKTRMRIMNTFFGLIIIYSIYLIYRLKHLLNKLNIYLFGFYIFMLGYAAYFFVIVNIYYIESDFLLMNSILNTLSTISGFLYVGFIILIVIYVVKFKSSLVKNISLTLFILPMIILLNLLFSTTIYDTNNPFHLSMLNYEVYDAAIYYILFTSVIISMTYFLIKKKIKKIA